MPFGVPFIGSRALVGTVDAVLLERKDALRPHLWQEAIRRTLASIFRDIPAGDRARPGLGLSRVSHRAGTRARRAKFAAWHRSEHCGADASTPILSRASKSRRHDTDAFCGTIRWPRRRMDFGKSNGKLCATPGLVATVGKLEALPGASNVIADEARASLDVRHADDAQRIAAVDRILFAARDIAQSRGLAFECSSRQEQGSVACDPALVLAMRKAVENAGFPAHRMISGAGHDAMILAQKMPVAMLFLRSPGGISHHPDESVLREDVAAALQTGLRFLDQLEELHA